MGNEQAIKRIETRVASILLEVGDLCTEVQRLRIATGGKQSITARIKRAIEVYGPIQVARITEIVNGKPRSVAVLTNRLKHKGEVVRTKEGWVIRG